MDIRFTSITPRGQKPPQWPRRQLMRTLGPGVGAATGVWNAYTPTKPPSGAAGLGTGQGLGAIESS